MSTADHLLIWIGAVPALLSGAAMLFVDQIAGGIVSLALGLLMLAVAFRLKV